MTVRSVWRKAVGHYRLPIRAAVIVTVGVLAVTMAVQARSGQAGSAESRSRASAGREWSTVMGDLANRYSPLDQITTQNGSALGAVWMSERLARHP